MKNNSFSKFLCRGLIKLLVDLLNTRHDFFYIFFEKKL